jgi:hypothetical protein
VCFGFLVVSGNRGALYAEVLLVFQGVYAYVGTRSLRRLPNFTISPAAEFAMLVLSQILVIAVLSLPIVVGSLFAGIGFVEVVKVFLICASTIVSATLVGIALPPERDNPFSVFVGLAVATVIMATLGLIVGVLSLPVPVVWALLVGAHVFMVCCGIWGIQELGKKGRYEACNYAG